MPQSTNNKKGFTLVEAVVVAVIVLVLAGIAIPIYNGFVNDARQGTVNNLAETAAAAANTFVRKTGNLTDVNQLDLHYDSNIFTISLPGGNNIKVDGYGKTKTVSYQ